jgi:hypothetical protein
MLTRQQGKPTFERCRQWQTAGSWGQSVEDGHLWRYAFWPAIVKIGCDPQSATVRVMPWEGTLDRRC